MQTAAGSPISQVSLTSSGLRVVKLRSALQARAEAKLGPAPLNGIQRFPSMTYLERSPTTGAGWMDLARSVVERNGSPKEIREMMERKAYLDSWPRAKE